MNRRVFRSRIPLRISLLLVGVLCAQSLATPRATAQQRRELRIPTAHGPADQPIVVIEPPSAATDQTIPLLVSLHTWSNDWQQRNPELEAAAAEKNWLVLQPNFHGPNRTPLACGSEAAQFQILEAVRWCCENYPVDRRRIYLTGVSGGGHMTLLMVGRYPQVWAAASAWVGISDLTAWHQVHQQRGSRYAADIEAACGGVPGASVEIDRQYHSRSPVNYLAAAKIVPLDIGAGIHDGHTGSVPVSHSLQAFNVIAQANGDEPLAPEAIEHWNEVTQTDPASLPVDPVWQRAIHLRRESGLARVTLFEGGHEGLADAAVDFLARHQREEPTQFDEATLQPTDSVHK